MHKVAFRAYNKKVLQSLTPSDSGMGISTEILIKSSNLGLKIAEVPTEIQYEGETSSQNPVSHGAGVLTEHTEIYLDRKTTEYFMVYRRSYFL